LVQQGLSIDAGASEFPHQLQDDFIDPCYATI
jgi:hypothetical protein